MFIGLINDLVNKFNHTKCVSLTYEKYTNNILSSYAVMNKLKDYIFMHLQLTQADVLEAVILLMACPKQNRKFKLT